MVLFRFSGGSASGARDQATEGQRHVGKDDEDDHDREPGVDYTEVALRDFEREIEELAQRRGYYASRRPRSFIKKMSGGVDYLMKGERRGSRIDSPPTEGGLLLSTSALNETGPENPSEKEEKVGVDEKRNSFNLHEYFRTEQEEKARSGIIGKHVGVLFEDLSVVRQTYVSPIIPNSAKSVIDMVNPIAIAKVVLGPLVRRVFPNHEDTYVLKGLTGLVKDGEMCLLLGRAGSGCTTFLKTVSLIHSDFKRVEGKLELAGIGMKHFSERFRGEVLYNPDKDAHIPVLTVRQTLDFALRFKTPGRRVIGLAKREFRERVLKLLLSMFKIQKIEDSLVGNAFQRGISGGERRRLTIAEMLAAGNAFSCWDNLISGLDSSTAFEVVRALRVLTDVTRTTAIVSMCQASEKIYSLFDKVMILDHGVMIYFGPASEACDYFDSLGYMRSSAESSPDFLMNVVDINTRRFNPKFDLKSIPINPEALRDSFLKSHLFENLKSEMSAYSGQAVLASRKDEFIRAVLDSKSKYSSKRSTFTVSYIRQVLILTLRNLVVIKQNRLDSILSISTLIFCAFTIGLGFFQMALDARGLFTRASILFLSVIFNALQHYSDLVEIYQNRFLVERHKNYRFYCTSAEKLAYFVSSIPRMLIKITIYTAIVYPLAGLKFGNFLALFSFYIIMILNSMCVLSLFMTIASLCKNFSVASRAASVVIFLIIVLSGFTVPQRFVPSILKWVHVINPVRCSFENCMIMEFRHISGLKCSDSDYIPNGPTYTDNRYKFCSLPGGDNEGTGIRGVEYIERIYGIEESSYWVNIGILLASIVVYLSLTCLFTELVTFDGVSSTLVLYTKPNKKEKELNLALEKRREKLIKTTLESQGLLPHTDADDSSVENGFDPKSEQLNYPGLKRGLSVKQSGTHADTSLYVQDNNTWDKTQSSGAINATDIQNNILLWRDVNYTVNMMGKDLVLTNNVSGYAKPGQLTALMGSSGAGKTTFMDVICARKTIGSVSGDILLGGSVIKSGYSGRHAYCEQLDILNCTSTIREAFRFSAYLRQSFDVPKHEKNLYVEELISLLELESIANAVIGDTMMNSGIDLAKRKLVSIGIELASKPSMAVVLDEPTTGLDTKSADDIIRLLKKIAMTGLSVICTIHQPNTTMFEQFDNVLLLMPGGKTAYFGPIGDDSSTVLNYFQSRGAVYDKSAMNPPEFIIDVVEPVTRIQGGRLDWAKEWEESEENKQLMDFLDKQISAISSKQIVHEYKESQRVLNSLPHHKPTNHKKSSIEKTNDNKSVSPKVPVPWFEQLKIVTRRDFIQIWRTPDYTTTRVFNHSVTALITFLSFSNTDSTPTGIQSRMFSLFQIVSFIPLVVPSTQLRFFRSRMLYSREESSGTYCKSVFALSLIISDIPLSIFCATIFGLIFYVPSAIRGDAGHIFFYLFAANITELFAMTMGMALSALTPSVYLASKFIPCVFLMLNLYSGVSVPYSTLPAFLKYTIYWINPLRYLMGALMESEFSDIPITCSSMEYIVFKPPQGQSCGEYMQAYIDSTKVGYLSNPDSRDACQFCSMSNGNEFLSIWGETLKGSYMVRDIFIFMLFVLANTGIIIIASKYLRFIKR